MYGDNDGTTADHALDAATSASRKAKKNADRITRLVTLLMAKGVITAEEMRQVEASEVWH